MSLLINIMHTAEQAELSQSLQTFTILLFNNIRLFSKLPVAVSYDFIDLLADPSKCVKSMVLEGSGPRFKPAVAQQIKLLSVTDIVSLSDV